MFTRRGFVRIGAATVGSLALRPFGLLPGLAQSGPDYRALVCVFLFGGNDSNNSVIPMDDASYQAYQSIRANLALTGSDLTATVDSASGAPLAFHAKLAEIASLFSSKELAVVANVGSLVQPLTRDQYQQSGAPIPSNLFSHADQQLQWQTSVAQGNSSTGWGGRAADYIASQNINAPGLPAFVSVAGNSLLGAGAETQPVAVAPGQSLQLKGFNDATASQARWNALNSLLKLDSGVSLVQAANNTLANSISDATALGSALAKATALKTQFPKTSLGAQLQQVAQIIQVQADLGMRRQIFFCSLGGFDTHTNEIATHNKLYPQLSPALAAFYEATQELGHGAERDHVHRIRFQPHLAADLGRRQRSCLGQPSFRARRRGAGRADLRQVPDIRSWAGRTTPTCAGAGFRRRRSISTAPRSAPGSASPIPRWLPCSPISPTSASKKLGFLS